MDIATAKQRLRESAGILRDGLATADRQRASAGFTDNFLTFIAGCPPGILACFWPMRSELDVRPLMIAMRKAGWRTALPKMQGKGLPLRFLEFAGEADLVAGRFGTSEPKPDADEVVPDLIAAPLLAYDAAGYRLGYGGGFYDRTLEKLRAEGTVTAIGVGFACQRVDEVPRGGYDQRLDGIVTDAESFWTGDPRCA